MSVFTDLLSLHGFRLNADPAPARSYAEGYGNATASRHAFPPLRGTPAPRSGTAPARVAATPPAPLALGGCR